MSDNIEIPVKNIFFMLSYAWGLTLPPYTRHEVGGSDYHDLLDLLSRVLVAEINRLFLHGLGRDYIEREERLSGVRGRIETGNTFRSLAWYHAKTICHYDELTHDVSINQVLKATLFRMLNIPQVKNKPDVRKVYDRLGQVSLVMKHPLNLMKNITIARHHRRYVWILMLCRFILENSRFNEDEGKFSFLELQRNESWLARLFETFVRNFYRKHLNVCCKDVKKEQLRWQYDPSSIQGKDLIPIMETDISISCRDYKIVIDTKFYKKMLKSSRTLLTESTTNQRAISSHLYQIYSYVSNLSFRDHMDVHGMLIYPVVKNDLNISFHLMNRHWVMLTTINLNQSWKKIEQDLKGLLRDFTNKIDPVQKPCESLIYS